MFAQVRRSGKALTESFASRTYLWGSMSYMCGHPNKRFILALSLFVFFNNQPFNFIFIMSGQELSTLHSESLRAMLTQAQEELQDAQAKWAE